MVKSYLSFFWGRLVKVLGICKDSVSVYQYNRESQTKTGDLTPLSYQLYWILKAVMSYPQRQVKLVSNGVANLLNISQSNIYYQAF